MNTYSTTNARNNFKEFYEALASGKEISLINKSKPILILKATIQPELKKFNYQAFKKSVVALRSRPGMPKTVKDAMQNYHNHMTKKYGNHLS